MSAPLKISNRDLLKLNEALGRLDGSKTGKDEIIPFEFTPEVSWKLAKNAVITGRAVLAYEKAVKQQAVQIGIKPGESITVGGTEKPDEAKLEKFLRLDEAKETLKDQEQDLSGILLITLAELLARTDGKSNPIPQSVRTGLVPIIEEKK